MRSGFLISLIVTIIFGGVYWYKNTDYACLVPIKYRIGEVDERFKINQLELKEVLSAAASSWGDVSGRDLFEYDDNSNFTINLIYDERQKLAHTEEERRVALDEKEKEGREILLIIEEKNEEYLSKQKIFKEKQKEYESDLNIYNEKVNKYNQEGGAPPDVFAELQSEKKRLEKSLSELTAEEDILANLIAEINNLDKIGNESIEEYNTGVREYNEIFGNLENFTQGDFKRDRINIYKFDSNEELKRVVIHEFGHALGVGHVDNEEAVMYYLTTDKFNASSLAPADVSALKEICVDDQALLSRIWKFIYNLNF